MAEVTFNLTDGLTEGSATHTECVLREPTAGELIDASEEAEKLVVHHFEPQLVTSPTLVGVNILRRQIVRIGDIQGPIERDMLNKLSVHDLNLIQRKAKALEHAALAVSQRGRRDGAGNADPPGDS